MNVILKENDWAKKMIEERTLGKKPSDTLKRVARYYIDMGYGEKQVRDLLDIFLLQCEPTSSLTKWAKSLDYALSRAYKYKAIDIDYIGISDTELDKILTLNSRQERRLAFTLLCLSKYWNKVTGNETYWVNNKDKEIMSMANVNTSIERQCLLFNRLREKGFLEFSKKVDNVNVRVTFADDLPPILYIDDFRNLGYQYNAHYGEPYFKCENCGITIRRTNKGPGRKQKYCKNCAEKIRILQSAESVMRSRAKNHKNAE